MITSLPSLPLSLPPSLPSSLPPILPPTLPPPSLQVVYVFGFIRHHVFCAVFNDEVKYVPSSGTGVALWFGVTAFLFCVHSMVCGQKMIIVAYLVDDL